VGADGRVIVRPIVIVSPPRSGSSLLFETLSQSPDLWSVGGESHAVIERAPGLHPAQRGWHSNRLGADAADALTVRRLRRRFHAVLHDRDGRRPSARHERLRLLEKTPRNALRIPFLHAVFPGATFLFLYREPSETMSSMLEGWRSGRHVSYPRLPGWRGPPWSFLLAPHWRTLPPDDLAVVVAHQWATTTRILLDDLASVPAGQRCTVAYADLVADPAAAIGRLCDRLGLRWDRPISVPLPVSRSTFEPPQPGKWLRNAAELQGVLAATADVAARAAAAAGVGCGVAS
jgi:hypothetical protein